MTLWPGSSSALGNAMAKKKVAKKKCAKKKTAKKKAAAMGHFGGVDLADVLRSEGVNEQGIPQVLALIRSLSDAQADENSTPFAPTPAPLNSHPELMVVATADALLEEKQGWWARTRQAIQSGRARDIDGCRVTFWDLEVIVRGAPRSSFVGRAIHEKASRLHPTESPAIYDAIYEANQNLLPPSLQLAVQTLRLRLEEDRTTREQNNRAASAVTKNLTPRITLLVARLQYAEVQKRGRTGKYHLTDFGRQVFENWPDWHESDANPWVADEPPTRNADTPTHIT